MSSRFRTSSLGRERPFEARAHRAFSVQLATDYHNSILRLVLQGQASSRLHRLYHPLAADGATISPLRSNTRMASCAART